MTTALLSEAEHRDDQCPPGFSALPSSSCRAEGGFEPMVSLYADDFLIHISKVNKFISILVENVMLLGLFVPKNELYLKVKNIQATINKSDAIK